jgi:hypothetical protein
MIGVFLLAMLLQYGSTVLENDYVLVSKNDAPHASGETLDFGARVVVALSTVELERSGTKKQLSRGDIVVFERGESYVPPSGGEYAEVAFKTNHPPVESPAELIPAEKNTILYDGERFFVFEEKLDPGDIRARHSHCQRVVIVLNATRLQQWPDNAPEVFKTLVPGTIKFNPPVIHVVKTIGEKPLRNIVIELKPEGSSTE